MGDGAETLGLTGALKAEAHFGLMCSGRLAAMTKIYKVICISALSLGIAFILSGCAKSTNRILTISEGDMHRLAYTDPLPNVINVKTPFTGVVVAQFHVNNMGKVISVSVLEAPNPEIIKVTDATLSKWKFSEISINTHDSYIAKMTLYFIAENGAKERVYYADNAPFIGLRPYKNFVTTQPEEEN